MRLALIEELEAHLHPQAQMRVIEYLQNEAERNIATPKQQLEGGGPKSDADSIPTNVEANRHAGFQAILTTHSPNLASKVRLKNVIICHGAQVFPMGDEFTRLRGPDYAFLERFLDVTKANLFFAKGVILVEGPSEELILPVLARTVGADLTKAGVSIVNVGNRALLRYARVFQRRDGTQMGIRVAVVTDLDVEPKDEDKKKHCGTQGEWKRQRLTRRFNGRGVETFVSPHWTLEYCIARSKSLCPLLYQAISGAIDEIRQDGKSIAAITATYEGFCHGRGQEEVASDLYQNVVVQKKISKPIVAQHFAAALENATIDEASLADKDSTGYLIDAIKYVTSANNNQ